MSSAARIRGTSARGRGDARNTTSARGSYNNARGNRGALKGASTSRGAFAQSATTSRPTQGRGAFSAGQPHQTIRKTGLSKVRQAAGDWQERYSTLQESRKRERADAIRNGIIADPDKPRTLAEAITPVGTCQDMCAEFERVERVVQKDVWKEETDPANLAANPLDREPDESRMIKKFRRAAAGIEEQLPSDLRPPHVLKRTCDYLFNEIVGQAETLGNVHHFVWDRTRAIRNDFSIQQISKPEELSIAIECYERIARFHMLSLHQLALPTKPYDKYDWQQEREQLDRTLLSLMQYYEDSRGKIELPNEAEFRAYCVIFQLQDPVPDLEDRVQTWPRTIALHPRVKKALQLYAAACTTNDMQGPLKPPATHAIAQQDWFKFWRLVESKGVSYLMACVAEIYFNHVRKTVLQALARSAGAKNMLQWDLDELRTMLAFDDDDEVEEFCERYGLAFKEVNGQMLLNLSVLKNRQLPDAKATATKQTKSHLVEQKRCNRTFPAIINGLSVQEAQQQGLIEEDDSEEMQDVDEMASANDDVDVQDASSDDGLFVSEKPATSSTTVPSGFGKPSTSPFASFGQPSNTKSATFGQPSSTSFAKPSSSPFAQPAAANTDPTASTSESSKAGATFGKPSTSIFSGTSPFGKPPATNNDTEEISKPQNAFNFKSGSPFASKEPEVGAQSPFAKPAAKPAFSFLSAPAQETATPQQSSTTSLFAPPTKPALQLPEVLTTAATQPPASAWSASEDPTSKAEASSNGLSSTKSPLFAAPPASAERKTEAFAPSETESRVLTPTQTTAKNDVFSFLKPAAPLDIPAAPQTNSVFSTAPQPSSSSPFKADSAFNATPKTQTPTATNATPNAIYPPATNTPQVKAVPTAPPVPPQKREPDAHEILNQVARHITLDEDTGFLKQYVDFVLGQVITEAQESVYFERINKEAQDYRSFKLSLRYGTFWRELCRRKRLARHGRGQRQRAYRRLHEIKSQQSTATSVADSTSTSSGKRGQTTTRKEVVDKMFQSSTNGGWRSRITSNGSQRSTTPDGEPPEALFSQHKNTATAKGISRIDNRGRVVKPTEASTSNTILRRSLQGASTSTPLRNTTHTNYFRRKALGMNVDDDLPVPSRKRGYSDISADSQHFSSSRSSPYSASKQQALVETDQAVTKVQKTNVDDDALFARLRAAREALAEGKTFWQTQVAQAQSPQSLGPTTYNSPSLERARAEARHRQSLANGEDVPAYRMRESKFVPRDSFINAMESAKAIRETRQASRPSSRISIHGTASPAVNGTNGITPASYDAPSPLPIEDEAQAEPAPFSAPSVQSFTQPAVMTNSSHALSHPSPVASATDAPKEDSQPSFATSSFGTFSSTTQSQAKLHPSLGHDFTIKPTEIPASLSASFRSSIMDDDHEVINHNETSHPAASFQTSHEHHSKQDGEDIAEQDELQGNGHQLNGRTSVSSSEQHEDVGYGHTNPFAMLQEADNDLDEEDVIQSEIDEGDEYDYSNGDGAGNAEESYSLDETDQDGDIEDEEDEAEYDEDEEEYDDDDEDDQSNHQSQYSKGPASLQQPNEALQAVGNNEDDAIELSD